MDGSHWAFGFGSHLEELNEALDHTGLDNKRLAIVVELYKARQLSQIADGLKYFKDLDLEIGNPILDVAGALGRIAEGLGGFIDVAEAIKEGLKDLADAVEVAKEVE